MTCRRPDDDGEPLPETRTTTRPSSMSRPTSPCRPAASSRRRSMSTASVPRIVAERVEYLDENGKLVTESLRDFTKKALKKALRQPRRFPQALEGGRTQAGDHRRTGSRGPAARSDRRGTRQGPRSLRPDLPRRLRPAKPLTRRERAENVKKRDVFAKYGTGPRRARCAARQVRRRRRAQPRRRERPADRALRPAGNADAARQSIRRQARLRAGRPRTAIRLYQETA